MTQSNPFNPPFTRLENLLHSAVGTPQWREGLDWYCHAFQKCEVFARKKRVSIEQSCAIYTLANINNSWDYVDKNAENIWFNHCMRMVKEKKKFLKYDDCAIYDLMFPKYSKSWCFAHNLNGHLNYVTVDRHMFRAAGLNVGIKNRRIIVSCVEYLAHRMCLKPAQAQAIIWLMQRRKV